MKINLNTTARDLEYNSGAESVTYELAESTSYQPGFLVSLIHFLISKLRSKPKFHLTIDISGFDEKEISRRFYEFYQLVSVLLFDDSNKISFGKKELDETLKNIYREKLSIQEDLYTIEVGSKIIEKYKSQELEEMRNSVFAVKSRDRLSKGFSFMIPCFDHLNELSRTDYFYSGGSIKSSTDIELWIKRLFKFHKLRLDPSGLHKKTTSHVSVIVKELFHNTHDWGRTTFNDKESYSPNLRACYLGLFLENRLSQKLGSMDSVDDYLKLVFKKEINDLQIHYGQQINLFGNDSKVSICEISVLDSGPGMARRWLEKDYNEINSTDEKEAVLRCFHKYITSDSSGLMSLRGQGLSKVLSLIGNIGFIRVHSGKVLLTRNFLDKKLLSREIETSSLDFDYRPVNRVEGTCITILYPIIYSLE